jgi:hypothetical protein
LSLLPPSIHPGVLVVGVVSLTPVHTTKEKERKGKKNKKKHKIT